MRWKAKNNFLMVEMTHFRYRKTQKVQTETLSFDMSIHSTTGPTRHLRENVLLNHSVFSQ